MPPEYQELLDKDGRDLKEAHVDGIGLPKRAALMAVQVLSRVDVPILGGKVFYVTKEKLWLTHDNWYCKHDGPPSSKEYARASAVQAERFLRDFPDSEDGTVFYQLVLPD